MRPRGSTGIVTFSVPRTADSSSPDETVITTLGVARAEISDCAYFAIPSQCYEPDSHGTHQESALTLEEFTGCDGHRIEGRVTTIGRRDCVRAEPSDAPRACSNRPVKLTALYGPGPRTRTMPHSGSAVRNR
jgi:hypothetical protein